MKFFIDTANLDDIKKAYKIGILSGVTTNPSLVAKEGVKFEDRIEEILQAVPEVESVSAEVTPHAVTAEEMIAEADELIKMNGGDKKITIKVPMTLAGLETTRYLSKKGCKSKCYAHFHCEPSPFSSTCRSCLCVTILRTSR